MTSAELLGQAEIPEESGIFFLGTFESRVTVLSQQIRALNLVDAILQEHRVRHNGRVAIIGGGAAGLTAAAAFATSLPASASVELYERRPELLHVQRESDRYLHPHIYDWPAEHSMNSRAGLPILDWKAGPAGAVADEIERRFNKIRNSRSISVKISRDVEKIHPFDHGGCRVVVAGAPNDGGDYDAAIISIGYGYERLMQGENKSYWSPFPLVGPIRSSEKHLIFVSGNGDGGLVDFVMAAFNGSRHQDIVNFFTAYPDLDEAKRILLDIEERAWSTELPAMDIYQEYLQRVRPALPRHFLMDVRDRLRTAEVWLHTREDALFRRDTAILNRFSAFSAIAADKSAALHRIHLSVGTSLTPSPPLTGPLTIKKGQSRGETISSLYRFLRFGADTEANFKPFQDLVQRYKNTGHGNPQLSRQATPSLNPSAKISLTLSIPAGSTETEPSSPPPSPAPDSMLSLSFFDNNVGPFVYFLLPFDGETIYSVPIQFILRNRSSRTVRNVNLSLEMSDSLYLHFLERSVDPLAAIRKVQVASDVGLNEHVARIVYHVPEIHPQMHFTIGDHIFARRSTILHLGDFPLTEGATSDNVLIKAVLSMPINITVDARDISPLKSEVRLQFRDGNIGEFDTFKRQEQALMQELLRQGTAIELRDITIFGFRKFSAVPAPVPLREAEISSVETHVVRVTSDGRILDLPREPTAS